MEEVTSKKSRLKSLKYRGTVVVGYHLFLKNHNKDFNLFEDKFIVDPFGAICVSLRENVKVLLGIT